MIGIMVGPYNNKVNHVKLGPAKALYYSLNEVYFVTISSLKYFGLSNSFIISFLNSFIVVGFGPGVAA